MPLAWNEIKHRAITFAKEWKDETREDAEAKTFWDDFFNVFGQKRRHLASYEDAVKKLSGDWGYIDLLWPGVMLPESERLQDLHRLRRRHRIHASLGRTRLRHPA